MNRQKIIEVLQNGNSPIKDGLIEALQNCPPGHRVILGPDGKVYPVRHDPMPPKTYVESLGTGSSLIYTGRSARGSKEETKRRRSRYI